jgi:very-long-chain enoyl-CoA reductase
VSRSPSVVLFLIVGFVQMQIWANGKEKRYRQEFDDKYKAKKYVVVPGIPGQVGSGRKSKK